MKKIFSLIFISSVLFLIASTNLNAAGSYWENYFKDKPLEGDSFCGSKISQGVVEWEDLDQTIILNYGGCGDTPDPFSFYPSYETRNVVFTGVENVDVSSSNEDIITGQLRPYTFSKEKSNYTEWIEWYNSLSLKAFNDKLEERYGTEFEPYTTKPTWWEYNELTSEPTSWWDFYGFDEDPTDTSVELLTYAKDLGKASLNLTADNKSPITIDWTIWAYGFSHTNSPGLIEILNNLERYQSLIDEFDQGGDPEHNFHYSVYDTEDMSSVINALKGKDIKLYVQVGMSDFILDGKEITSTVNTGFTFNYELSLTNSKNSNNIKKLVNLENPVFIEFDYTGPSPIPFEFRYNIASYYYWNDEAEIKKCEVFSNNNQWDKWDECYSKVIDKRFDYLDKTEFTLLRYNPSTNSIEVIEENVKINPSSLDIELVFDHLGSYILVTDYSVNTSKKNLKLSPDVNGNIKINFDIIDKAEGYKIYRSTDNKKFTLLKETTTNDYIDNTAVANTKYYYKVTSFKTVNEKKQESENFNIGNYTYKLTSPSITLSNISTTSIKISYPKVAKATGYEIYRATSKTGKYTLVKSTSALNFTNTGLTFNKTYYYKVRAYNTINGKKVYSGYSGIKSIKALPGAPTVKTASTGYNSVKISYAKVSGANGYEISRYDSVSNKWTVVKVTSDLSYTNSLLVTGREYQYRARSYKTASGKKVYGPYSSIVKATPIPSTPTLNGKSLTSNDVLIEWNKISGATGYLVEIIFDDPDSPVKSFETASTTYNFTEATDIDVAYNYNVTAFREVSGEKIYSKTATKRINTTPTQAKITDIKTSVSKISFKYGKEHEETIDGFIIKRSTSLTGPYTEVLKISYADAQTNNFLFEDTSIVANKTYYYNIYTYKEKSGTPENYDVLSAVKSIKASSLPMVANVTLTNASYKSMKISWGKVDGASGYQIYRATSKNGKYTLVKTTSSDSLSNTGLTFNKTYFYKVRVYSTINGKQIYSAYSSVKSKKTVTQSPTVTLTNTNYNTNKISWKKIDGATGYQISRYDAGTGKWTVIKTITKGTTITYTDSKLVTGREYKYKVNAYRTSGGKKIYGISSSEKAVTVLPTTPNVTAKSIDTSSVKISWNKIDGATGYRIYVYNVTDDILHRDYFDVTTTSYTDASVTLNKTYRYEVEAYRTVSGVKHYSKPFKTNIKVTPTAATTLDTFSTLTMNSFEYGAENNIVVEGFIIKRSDSSTGTYTEIADILYSNATSSNFVYEDKGLSPNKTYYYEIYTYVTLGGEKILSVPKKISLKSVLETPFFQLTHFSNRDALVTLLTTSIYDIDGYEIYRSTTKTGTYTKVKTTGKSDDYIHWINENLSAGSTYYYKVKSFKTINGTKYYSNYSGIQNIKLSLKSINKYPLTLYLYDGSTIKMTNVSVNKKSYSGDYINYTMTVKATVNSKKAQTAYAFIDLHNYLWQFSESSYDDYYNEFQMLTFKLSKGKYTKTFTFTIKLHKTSLYYEFN